VQTDREHEEPDADLGELERDVGVGDEAGGVRADRDDRRQLREPSKESPDEGSPEPQGDRRDQVAAVRVDDGLLGGIGERPRLIVRGAWVRALRAGGGRTPARP
jgi:hypothetical protein